MLSVVVPVYNAENSIRRCIDSILLQSYSDFELLLIDDGSIDNSGRICDEYAEKDSRVRVFHKPNGGVSSARNLGLDHAKGEWIAFVDSDDCVSESYLHNLWSHSSCVDLVISYAELVYLDGSRRREVYKSKLVTDDYNVLFVANDLSWHTSPWSKLFNKNICGDLRFVEGMHIGEDLVFLYSYILKCDKIYVSSDTDYCYYVDNQCSLTKRINNLDEELLAYNQVSDIVWQIINTKKITDSVALSKLGWTMACYVRRVLNAIYYGREKLSIANRIKCIKELDIEKYVNHIEISSNKERIYVYMLKCHLYVAYDILRMFVGWMKR